jgi:putative transposase
MKKKKKDENINIKVEKHLIRDKNDIKTIKELCFKSKNLYNLANYYIRTTFAYANKEERTEEQQKWIDNINNMIDEFNSVRYEKYLKSLKKKEEKGEEIEEFKPLHKIEKGNGYLSRGFIDWIFINEKLPMINNPYRTLPAQTSQQILKKLDENWKSFSKSIKEWKINPSKFKGRPNLPKYKDKIKGENIVIFTGQAFTNQKTKILKKDKKGYIHFPNEIPLKIKTKANKINEVRIVPHRHSYTIEVVYEDDPFPELKNGERAIGVDVGIDCLMTVTGNFNLKPYIINGKPIKSINTYYNKLKAEAMSFVGNRGTSNRLKRIELKRKNKIDTIFHWASRYLIDFCVDHDVSKIFIGWNKDIKQNINLGKNNVPFVYIPFRQLFEKIKYKAREVGIEVIEINESHTSKCDALALEKICHHEKYLGKRVKRGMFISSTGRLIHADVNASLNILRRGLNNDDFILDLLKNKVDLTPIIINYKNNVLTYKE